MPDYTKISELPAGSSAAGTDQMELNQGGTSRRLTLEQAVKAAGATATNAQATVGSNTVVGTTPTNVASVGPLGANGQVWEINGFAIYTDVGGGGGGYWDINLWNGAASIAHVSDFLPAAGQQHNGALTAIVTLTGATTFSLRGNGPSTFSNILTDSRITAKRLA